MREQHLIYIPGLRDQWFLNSQLVKFLPLFWKPQGFVPHIIAPHWEEGERFAPKLKMITDKIDELVAQGHKVSLIGQSAGGSAALNAFCARKDVVNGVVNATGRLKSGVGLKPSLDRAAQYSPAFKESVLFFEKENEPAMSYVDRKKVLTARLIWDEAVPGPTVAVRGAKNIVIPLPEHMLGGTYIITLYSPFIVNFLKNIH